MKTKSSILLLLFSSALLPLLLSIPRQSAQAQAPSPTPTYDPFAQPPLPANPTQLEHGRYLFWRYCMPCHGDLGQGLTDEFRRQWEPEHQNCWARGCHSGRYKDDSFPVPTIVPPNVRPGLLDQYTPDSLFQFLQSTHPPEAPGSLTDDEYRALVAILYHMNRMPLPAPTSTPPPASTPTSNLPTFHTAWTRPCLAAVSVAVILILLLLLQRKQDAL